MTTLKTVAARIRSSEADYDKDAPDYEGLAESASKYRKEIMALSGVDIMKNENEYKSTKQIFEEIAGVWNQMSDVSQAALAERLGGKRNMNVVMSIIQNIKDLKGAYEDSMTAAGTAAEANEIYMDSISGKVGQFKAQWDVFSYTTLDSNLVKPFIGGATELLSVLTSVINALKQLGPVLPAAGLLAFGKTILGVSKDLKDVNGVIGVVSKKIYDFGRNSKASFQLAGEWIKQNPWKAAGVGIAAAGAAILLQISYLDSYAKKHKDFQNSLEKSQALANEAASYDATIESNKSRISALESMKDSAKGLSSVDQAELSILKEQTAELERQKQIKQTLAGIQADVTSENANAALNTKTGFFDLVSGAFHGDYKEYRTNLFDGLTPIENLQNNVGFLREQVEKKKKLEKELKDMDKHPWSLNTEANKKHYKKVGEELDKTNKKILETQSNLSDNISVVSTYAGSLDQTKPDAKAEADKAFKAAGEATRYLGETQGKSIYNSIEEAFTNGSLGETGKKLTGLASISPITEDQVNMLRQSSDELDSYMRTTGVTAKEITEYTNDSAAATKKLADSGMSAGLILRAYSGQLQTIETNLGTLDSAYSKLSSGDFSLADLAQLEESFPGIADGVGDASTGFAGLAENIRRAKDEQPEALVEILEGMKEGASDAQISVIDNIIGEVENMPNAIDGATDAYGRMADAIRDAEAAQIELNSVLSEPESDIEFLTESQAYKAMQQYEKKGKIASGNEKYYKLAAHLVPGIDNSTPKKTMESIEKIKAWEKEWGSVYASGTDSSGNWTVDGAKKAVAVLAGNKEFMDQLVKLGGKFDYNFKTGEIKDFYFNAESLPLLASSANLTPEAYTGLIDEISQFVNLDYNAEKPLSYFARIGDGARAVYDDIGNFKWFEISQSDIDRGAKEVGVTSKQFTEKVKNETNGRIKINVDADTSEVEKEVKETKNDVEKKDNPKVTVDADTSDADKKVKDAKDKAKDNPPEIPIKADGNFLDQAKDKLDKTLPTVEVGADTSKADEKVKQTKDNWENIPSDVKVDADTSTADEDVKQVKDNWENIPSDVKVDADTSGADKEVDKVKAGIESSPAKITVEADTKPAEKKIDKAKRPDYSGSSDRHQGRQHESEQVKRDSHYAKGAATAVGGKVGSIVKSTVDKIKNGSTQNTMTVDANTSPAQQKINTLIQQIEGKTYKINVDTSGGESGGASITESATKSVTGFAGKIAGLFKNRKVNISANVSGTKEVDNLNKSTKQVKGKKVEVKATPKGEPGVKSLHKGIEQVKPKKVDVKANAKGEGEVRRLRSGIEQVKPKSVTVKANTSGTGLIDGLLSKLGSLHDKKVTITTEHRTVDKKIYTEGAKRRRSNQGSSGLFGNAFKSGTWGAKGSGRALGGEVGRKILRPRIVICV